MDDYFVWSWLGAFSVPIHFPNQCSLIVLIEPLEQKNKWNLHENTTILIQRNESENVIYQIAAILSLQHHTMNDQPGCFLQ